MVCPINFTPLQTYYTSSCKKFKPPAEHYITVLTSNTLQSARYMAIITRSMYFYIYLSGSITGLPRMLYILPRFTTVAAIVGSTVIVCCWRTLISRTYSRWATATRLNPVCVLLIFYILVMPLQLPISKSSAS
jgi:hypothetical protein